MTPVVYQPVDLAYATVRRQPVVNGTIVESRWYLGLAGTVLPGKGFGIDTVEEGSPSEMAGLKPGMVITRCNDEPIVDDSSFANAISSSGGVLNIELLDKLDGEPTEATVAMTKLDRVSY